MMQKSLIEINGIKYMSPKAAGGLWGMSSQKVTTECKAGRIVGATKDSGGHWIIPIDSKKPLDRETIRKTLVALLAMKNRPGTSLFDESGADDLFAYLRDIGLVEGSSLTSASLTNAGMDIATSGKRVKIDWFNAGATIIGIVGSAASIWSAIPK